MLDAYYIPHNKDKRKKRPAVIHMHGGSFMFNDKSDEEQVQYAMMLATRGYNVYQINYRLTGDADDGKGGEDWNKEGEKYDA